MCSHTSNTHTNAIQISNIHTSKENVITRVTHVSRLLDLLSCLLQQLIKVHHASTPRLGLIFFLNLLVAIKISILNITKLASTTKTQVKAPQCRNGFTLFNSRISIAGVHEGHKTIVVPMFTEVYLYVFYFSKMAKVFSQLTTSIAAWQTPHIHYASILHLSFLFFFSFLLSLLPPPLLGQASFFDSLSLDRVTTASASASVFLRT